MDVTQATFQSEVIQRSKTVPVVVDFWAAWCAPCRALGPVLERLESEAQGAWVLAKVDVDSNQYLASQLGVQGIPRVLGFRDGRVVMDFTGALPEAQVRERLTALGPSRGEVAVAEAQALESSGDKAGALEAYRRALASEPANLTAREGVARLEVARRASEADEDALARRLAADPLDLEAAGGLADIALGRGEASHAFELLLNVVRSTSGEQREAARKRLVELLDTLPPSDERALSARRALANALF